ncbi:MAG TPA: flagellar assembly protein FliH [Macromonas sp.]|nr:flagellar assembly protein FliH [Macromonas sp.]
MPSSNKPNPYQRFIPREEVQDVAAWEFNAMDGGGKNAKAAAAIEEPAPEVISSEALDEARQIAHAEGFEHGRLAGAKETRDALEAPLKRQTQEQAQRLAQLLQATQTGLTQLEDQLASQLLELACDLARQVVRRELQQPLEPLKTVVQEALALAVEDHSPATLKLHPKDLELLKADLGDTLTEQRIRLLADPTLSPGGCVVESAQGAVDGTLEKRWARAVANLGLNPPWTPKEHPDD